MNLRGSLLWRVLRWPLLVLAALVLAIEEWGWRPLTAWAARLAQWPPLARLEQRVRRAPPRVALALFGAPAVLLFPVKLLALAVMQHGHAAGGLLVLIAAKLIGTAFVGRLFILTEPQLLTFPWFARGLSWWRRTKLRVKAAFSASPAWQALLRARRRFALCRRRWSRAMR